MAKKNTKGNNLLGSWSFLVGVILAVAFGFIVGLLQIKFHPILIWILVVLGLVVGLLNIADEEVNPFLMSGTVLVIIAALGQSVVTPLSVLPEVFQAMIMLFVPATTIVAIKNVFALAKR